MAPHGAGGAAADARAEARRGECGGALCYADSKSRGLSLRGGLVLHRMVRGVLGGSVARCAAPSALLERLHAQRSTDPVRAEAQLLGRGRDNG